MGIRFTNKQVNTKPLEFASARNKITWSQVVKRSADYNHWQQ